MSLICVKLGLVDCVCGVISMVCGCYRVGWGVVFIDYDLHGGHCRC